MKMTEVTRKSFGKSVSLGSLYDARSDKIQTTNLFNQQLPNEVITSIDTPSTDYRYFDESLNVKSYENQQVNYIQYIIDTL